VEFIVLLSLIINRKGQGEREVFWLHIYNTVVCHRYSRVYTGCFRVFRTDIENDLSRHTVEAKTYQ